MGEFDELDASMAKARAVRDRHHAEELKRQEEVADFHRRFRAWAEDVAAPTLDAVADHVKGLYEYTSTHVHHPDHGAGGRESVDLNIQMMGEYIQLTFRALGPESEVGISENHGAETTALLATLTAEEIRRRAIHLVTEAIIKAGGRA
jgi:hypothetical protein